MNSPNSSVFAVEAYYAPQSIPQFRDNPLICALPPACDDDVLSEQLTDMPDFSPTQRNWPAYDRLFMVASLSSFKLPFERDIQTARAFDTLIRKGYVGRAPRSAGHTKVFQKLYEDQQRGFKFNRAILLPIESQLSSSIIGLSGIGKTTTIRRIFSRYPQVIHHPDYHVTQIPYLHIEAPHDGISVKGLAESIIRKIDQLVPLGRYHELHLHRKSQSGEALLNHCARIMHMHFVGILVVDEIQNLENAGTTRRTLMSALVSASNELGVPIVFVGTSRATKVLGLDFRQGRRSTGNGFPVWGPLVRSGSLDDPGEWELFAQCLWQYQWNQVTVQFNDAWSQLFFEYCQGIADIAIKLFICAQWRAMLDGTETFSMQTFASIMKNELALIEPMLDAMRRQDNRALERYHDLNTPTSDAMLEDALNAYAGIRQRGAEIRPGDAAFVPRVSAVLIEAGIEEQRAFSAAQKVEQCGEVMGIVAGAAAALELTRPIRTAKRHGKSNNQELPELAPDDYRHAAQKAMTHGGTIFSHLHAMGAVCDLDHIITLN
ncbi:AAA family ATPase [Burkholderia pyrrocinia]|uniref:AAA family ATPase n=1 Tax=Burkholderia pyrrocinia TaxID=60550 RepID=UPI002AB073E8|nr:AAA family ATPase [Burkholderia pyrrocinia]